MTDTAFPPPTAEPPGRSDRILLQALASGDRSAADELVRRTYRKTWASLYRLTGGDGELAADLCQEAYRKAWASLASFDGRSRFSTWLYRIAYTTFLNHIRRPRRVVPLEEGVIERKPAPNPGPEAMAQQGQRDEALRKAVLGLPDPFRETVTARFWGEVSVKELAAAEGITEPAIRKRLKKALSILRTEMEVAS